MLSGPNFNPSDLEVAPIERSETIPSAWYTSAEVFRFDQEMLLAGHWQYMCHEDRVTEPGQYAVEVVAGQSLLLVRGNDGKLTCFFNVCRHRGGPLAKEDGRGKVLRCLYHAWTYDLQGKLIGAPKFEGVENFDKEKCRLPQVAIKVWQGLVFADISGKAPPFEDYFNGIAERILPINLGDMSFSFRTVYDMKCNWKVYVDNFMEGYHILPVHPELAKILDVAGYKTELETHRVLQWGKIQPGDHPYHVTEGSAFYYFIFPNIMLNILPGRLQVNSILPVAPDRTITVFDFFYTEKDEAKLAVLKEDDGRISDLIQKQDIEICELVQKGLESRSYDKGRLSVLEEKGVYGFQTNLRKAYKKMSKTS